MSLQFPLVHNPLGQGPLRAGSLVGEDSRGVMWVLVAPEFWSVSGGEAGEIVGTERGWTPGFWECTGLHTCSGTKSPQGGYFP